MTIGTIGIDGSIVVLVVGGCEGGPQDTKIRSHEGTKIRNN